MAAQAAKKSSVRVSSGVPLLGFHVLVAPVSENVKAKHKMPSGATQGRPLQQLLGGSHAPPQVGPGLRHCLRKILEQQKMPTEDIESFLSGQKSLQRYDSAFRKLYSVLQGRGTTPEKATVAEIAQALFAINKLDPNGARNAYSAALLFPGTQGLRFHQLITVIKKSWKSDAPKYGTFWAAEPVLSTLLQVAPATLSLSELRTHTILVLRLLHLMRGIDLARAIRTVSMVNGRPFFRIQRKGWKTHRWEELLVLETSPTVCPWSLIKLYVARTPLVPPGGPLFVTLDPPLRG
jgi:hypothetical protein